MSIEPQAPLPAWGEIAQNVFWLTFPIAPTLRILDGIFGWGGLDDGPWVPFGYTLAAVALSSAAVWAMAAWRRARAAARI